MIILVVLGFIDGFTDSNYLFIKKQGTTTTTPGTTTTTPGTTTTTPLPTTTLPVINDGDTVMCTVGGTEGYNYRYNKYQNSIRHYPNPEIAKSWNPDWDKNVKKTDCSSYKIDQPFVQKTKIEDPGKLEVGWAVRCANEGEDINNTYQLKENNVIRWYPSTEIALSHDKHYYRAAPINCQNAIKGAPMEKGPY